jgi:hypothetical protein
MRPRLARVSAVAWRFAVVASTVIAVVFAAGCKQKKTVGSDQIGLAEANARAALAGPILAKIAKINVAAAPAVKADKRLPGRIPARVSNYDPRPDEESILVYPEDLASPSKLNEIPYEVPHSELARCTKNLADVKDPGDEVGFYKIVLQGCTKLKYLWVVRTTKIVKPVVGAETVDEQKRTRTTEFTPGSVAGEVIAFEIATGKLVGGVRFSARSSDKPEEGKGGTRQSVLDEDLKNRVVEAVVAAVQR